MISEQFIVGIDNTDGAGCEGTGALTMALSAEVASAGWGEPPATVTVIAHFSSSYAQTWSAMAAPSGGQAAASAASKRDRRTPSPRNPAGKRPSARSEPTW